jgi:hypothetical protein
MTPVSSKVCVTKILEPGAWAKIPIKDKLSQIPLPTIFLYGADSDWMSPSDVEEMFSQNK